MPQTAFTDYAENKLLDFLFRGQALTLPANWYFGLLTASTDDTAAGLQEVTGAGYARVADARSLANFSGTQGSATTAASSGTSGTIYDVNDITFGQPTGDWATGAAKITTLAIFDAASGGNLWMYQDLGVQKTVAAGDAPPKFPAGAFSFQIDN